MRRGVVLFGVVVAIAGAAVGIYDHQRIQHQINRTSKTSVKASTRLHKQKTKQKSRDITFGVITGVGVLIAVGAASRGRRRASVPKT